MQHERRVIMKKDYRELNRLGKAKREEGVYAAFGINLSVGDEMTITEFYDELDEEFHDQVSFDEFAGWIKDGVLYLYDNEGFEVEILFTLIDKKVKITAIGYC